MKINKNNLFLIQDAVIIITSILIAVFLAKTQILAKILASTQGLEIIGSFLAGTFFTSIFTTAPAIVVLGEIAKTNSIFLTAFLGGFGALVGDLVIFWFIRDRLSEHLTHLVSNKGCMTRLKILTKFRFFKWLTFLVAGLIIASPLPDELGISLLGFSKTRTSLFIPLSFAFNFLGILLIGIIAKSIF